jgi:hypothetical protein
MLNTKDKKKNPSSIKSLKMKLLLRDVYLSRGKIRNKLQVSKP